MGTEIQFSAVAGFQEAVLFVWKIRLFPLA